jgi:hypothetical protein
LASIANDPSDAGGICNSMYACGMKDWEKSILRTWATKVRWTDSSMSKINSKLPLHSHHLLPYF